MTERVTWLTFLKYNDVIAPIKVEIAATRVIIKANQISDDAKLVMIYPYFLFILNHLWFCYVIIIKTASVPTGKYRLKTPAILRNSRINGKTKRNIFNDDIIVSQVDSYPESPIRFAVYQFFIVGGNHTEITERRNGNPESFFNIGQEKVVAKEDDSFDFLLVYRMKIREYSDLPYTKNRPDNAGFLSHNVRRYRNGI